MAEYNYPLQGRYEFFDRQEKVARWVNKTNQLPTADPYQAATPAYDVPRDLLPTERLVDSNAPWLVSQGATKKKTRRRRTPSEKEFDRERRNDYKYSHREHMDALRAAAARADAHRPQTAPPERGRRLSPAPPPPPLQKHSLHPGGMYPAVYRLSDSQDTSSSSRGYEVPYAQANRNLPGPMPVKAMYAGAPGNANIDSFPPLSPPPVRQKPKRSHKPLRVPPASAPAYHNRLIPPTFAQSQEASSYSKRPYNYPYTYASSPLAPPNSAPAQSRGFPRQSAPVIPDPLTLYTPKSRASNDRPFLQRVFKPLLGRRSPSPPSGSPSRSRSQPPPPLHSPLQPRTPAGLHYPTSPTKSGSGWLADAGWDAGWTAESGENGDRGRDKSRVPYAGYEKDIKKTEKKNKEKNKQRDRSSSRSQSRERGRERERRRDRDRESRHRSNGGHWERRRP
ncbi:hypothetical protein H0H87_005744 [Tephrocybe sp. NHM501043]|nr:hypothetical protein H0H87_005744 [Tephrocybe sp. NHM501043]